VAAAPLRHTVLPLNFMQTSQWNFDTLEVVIIIATMNPAMKITPAITGHFFLLAAMSSLRSLRLPSASLREPPNDEILKATLHER